MLHEKMAGAADFSVGWDTYIPYIVQGAEVTPQLKAFLDSFRERILNGFVGQGKRTPKDILSSQIRY